MPRYFFHVDGPFPYADHDGIDLADDDVAWTTAIVSLAELVKELNGRMPDGAEIGSRVVDSDGRLLVTLRFAGERHGRAVRPR